MDLLIQGLVMGIVQGLTEFLPISSSGHLIIVPFLLGWTDPFITSLAFSVMLHIGTLIALLVFFWRDWVRIIAAFFRSCARRSVETSDERLAWLIVIATIPVGITGLLLEHSFRTLFAKPLAAAMFLFINGLILLVGERLRRDAERREAERQGAVLAESSAAVDDHGRLVVGERRTLVDLRYREAGIIGAFQTFALFAGISRSGITMVGGLLRGLDHEDAAKFSFLLATPVIFAAGVLKLPVRQETVSVDRCSSDASSPA
jgi:undecaprenyl-diphosphatase